MVEINRKTIQPRPAQVTNLQNHELNKWLSQATRHLGGCKTMVTHTQSQKELELKLIKY